MESITLKTLRSCVDMKAVHARRASGESLRAIARDLGVSAGLLVKRGKEEAPPPRLKS